MAANDAFAADGIKLLAAFGETVIRWPLGESDDAENVTANVDLDDETMPAQLAGGPRVRDRDGERIVRRGRLDVLPAQSLDDRDRWVIAGEHWQTVRIHGRDAGLVTVTIERLEGVRTAKRRDQAR